jgi:AraC-like DNA-binding protein
MEISIIDLNKNKIKLADLNNLNYKSEIDLHDKSINMYMEGLDIKIDNKCCKDFQIIHAKLFCEKTETVTIGHKDKGFIVLYYILHGKIEIKEENKSFYLSHQQQYNGTANNLEFSFTQHLEIIILKVNSFFFKSITNNSFNELINKLEARYYNHDIDLILQSIINQKFKGVSEKIYLVSKVYELVAQHIKQASTDRKSILKNEDFDKIILAKTIVDTNLQAPYKLIDLARLVGINDFKLKIGFKELTGNTVFGYINQVRMNNAYQLLANDFKTVSEVAFLVGYKNAQHFTVAFKKQFNILPGSLNKVKLNN